MYRGTSTSYLNFVGKEEDEDTPPMMTRASGEPIPNYKSSLTVGPRGCPLMSDHFLLEDMQHNNRARVPERVFHARGAGAHGYFEVTKDITKYCAAKLFNEVGKRTPIFSRFSVANSRLGSAETDRGVRGMAFKFYTEEGNWDLTALNFQPFPLNDPIFVNSIHFSSTPEPASNLTDPNRFWDFLSLLPESVFFQIWFQTDFSLPYSYRFIDGHGVNTYKLINKHGEPIYTRFTLVSNQGLKSLTPQKATQLTGSNPDHATEDLAQAIERGDYPSWTLNIQVMSYEVAQELEYNPFDVTKIWAVDRFPMIEVGRIILNKNTSNHFNEAEQAIFNPGNFVPGIRAAEGDRNLAGRIMAYSDTQMYRMGVNHSQIPINSPLNPVRNYQREGKAVFVSQGAAPIYFPNSFGGPVESEEAAELDPVFRACGDIVRKDNSEGDHYTQPRMFWNSLLEDHQKRVIAGFGNSLRPVQGMIQKRVLGILEKVDKILAEKVEEAIEQEPDD